MRSLFPVSTNDFLFPDTAFDNIFKGFFQPSAVPQFNVPKVDIQDTDTAYVVTADLPGAKKEDINITYDNDILTISAQHSQEKEDKDEEKHYIRRERMSSSFNRQFVVRNIQKDGIDAEFKDGVLKINLPKADPKLLETSHRIEIQ
jgi:HSP20 family protein